VFGVAVEERGVQLLGAELFVGEIHQAAGIQRGAQAHGAEGARAREDAFAQQANGRVTGQARQGVDAHGRVVVVVGIQARVQVGPVFAQQGVDQFQNVGQPGHTLEGEGTLQEEMGDAQVFAALQQVEALLLDAAPVRRLGGQDGITHAALRLALGITLQLEKLRVIFHVFATRRSRGNGGEQQRHIH